MEEENKEEIEVQTGFRLFPANTNAKIYWNIRVLGGIFHNSKFYIQLGYVVNIFTKLNKNIFKKQLSEW